MMNFCDLKKTAKRVVKCVYKKAELLAEAAKLTIEIESHKNRLSEAYEKIGECVVGGSLSSSEDEEERIFKYVDEAKLERDNIGKLYAKRKKVCDKVKSSCPPSGE